MRKKISKFIFLTVLLVLVRLSDFYCTSLWFFNNSEDETSPLTSFLGLDWSVLIILNLIVTGLIIAAFYYYSFHYSIVKLTNKTELFTDFISKLYSNEKGKFYQVFYKMPKNKKTLIGHTGYVLIRVVIIGSILATVHNLCQYYDNPIYTEFRQFVKRPSFFIYGVIIFSFMYYSIRIWKKEFEIAKINLSRNNHFSS